jgi:tetratricopeptide (TPR) repeat protein
LTGFVYEPQMFVRFRPGLVVTTADPRTVKARDALAFGEAERALAIYQQILASSSNDVAAHLGVAECHRMLGRSADALREYDWVFAKSPGLPEVSYDRGSLLLSALSLRGGSIDAQAAELVADLSRYKSLRPSGGAEDIDELLNRAKAMQAELRAAKP